MQMKENHANKITFSIKLISMCFDCFFVAIYFHFSQQKLLQSNQFFGLCQTTVHIV